MRKKITDVLKWLSVAMIAPAVFHGIVALADPGSVGGYTTIILICFLSSFALIFIEEDEKNANGRAGFYLVWNLITAIGFTINSGFDGTFSVSRTTVLIAGLVWLSLLIDSLARAATRFQKKRKREEVERQKAEQQAFVDRINNLIGDISQTKALLAAIERLTKYAPDEANHILGALSRDAERYVMLRANQETSDNEVLAQESSRQADEIAQDARALCADATEMALELLREHQAAEAEERLGYGTRGSELARASADFRKYLKGLREVNEHLGPGRDESLRQEIDALGPQTEVKELPAKADKSRRRLRSSI